MRVVALTARSMQNNVTLSGVTGDNKGEKCKVTTLEFLRNTMGIQEQETEILVAHRIGKQFYHSKGQTMTTICG